MEERDLGPSLGCQRRVLCDDENVQQVQARWTTLGRFFAVERSRLRARNGNVEWNEKLSPTPDLTKPSTMLGFRSASVFTKRFQSNKRNKLQVCCYSFSYHLTESIIIIY